MSLHNLAGDATRQLKLKHLPLAVAFPPVMDMMTSNASWVGRVGGGWRRCLKGLNPTPTHKFAPSPPCLRDQAVEVAMKVAERGGGWVWGSLSPSEKPLLCTSQQPIAAGSGRRQQRRRKRRRRVARRPAVTLME